MLNFRALIDSFRDCGCGMDHRCGIHDIRIGSGLVTQVGEILRENGFPRRLLLIGDRDTLAAAAGIEESLTGFEVTRHCYDTLRVATMDDVRLVEDYLDRVDAVVAVGAGSFLTAGAKRGDYEEVTRTARAFADKVKQIKGGAR